MALLQSIRPFRNDRELTAAQRLVRSLAPSELALRIVRGCLEVYPNITCADFIELPTWVGIERIENSQESTGKQSHPLPPELRVRVVLDPVLDSLDPFERRLLEFASLLPPDWIPVEWLRDLLSKDFPDYSRSLEMDRHTSCTNALGRLERLGLITILNSERLRGDSIEIPSTIHNRVFARMGKRAVDQRFGWVEGMVLARLDALIDLDFVSTPAPLPPDYTALERLTCYWSEECVVVHSGMNQLLASREIVRHLAEELNRMRRP